MPALPVPDDSFDFEENFQKIPLFWKFSDPTLKPLLIHFLNQWNKSTHIAWKESYCPEMVDHGIVHSRNLFMIANRLFHDNDNLIENLNDGEIACFTLSLWLHDISMSKSLFSIDEEDRKELKRFLEGYPILSQGSPIKIKLDNLRDITTMWVRKYHHLLSNWVVTADKTNISFGIDEDEQLRETVGKLCFFHSSMVRLSNCDEIKEYYNILPVEQQRKGYDTLRLGKQVYKINLMFLGALLRFVDACDQTNKRLIDKNYTKQFLDRNRASRDLIIEELKNNSDKTDHPIIEQFKGISECSIIHDEKKLKNQFDQLRKKYDLFNAELDELEHICFFRKNMDYKKSVNDIFFKDGSIILEVPDSRHPDSEEQVKEDILRELKSIKDILKHPPNDPRDIGIPSFSNDPYNSESFIIKVYCEKNEFEVPEYEIFQRVGHNGFDQPAFIAQRSHEGYLISERSKGDTVLTNYNLHLWNRVSLNSRELNLDLAKKYSDYLREINCEMVLESSDPENNFSFTKEEIEKLAISEHTRWMNKYAKAGFTYSDKRDDDRKKHPGMVPWAVLSEADRQKDRNIILKMPGVLRKLNLAIKRKT